MNKGVSLRCLCENGTPDSKGEDRGSITGTEEGQSKDVVSGQPPRWVADCPNAGDFICLAKTPRVACQLWLAKLTAVPGHLLSSSVFLQDPEMWVE